MSTLKTIAVIGRPNVGKSTLFNRLVGRKQAIVDDEPGVTRDRKFGNGSIGDLEFNVIDTPGLETLEDASLQGRMFAQSMKAVEEADLILLVFDAIEGVTPRDEFFAQIIRRTSAPVILIANKAEGRRAQQNIVEGFNLGFGEPVAISAEHGEGLADLYEAVAPFVDNEEESSYDDDHIAEVEANISVDNLDDDSVTAEVDEGAPLQIAIIGRPNVGKSTLMNALLGEDRMLTGPEAGITRDSIMVKTEFNGRTIKLVDTAGMRRKAKVQERLERMSVSESTHALRFAHVVVLVLDATQPLEKQDNAIAGLIEREGRACVIALNKWDLVEEKDEMLIRLRERLADVIPQMKDITLTPISALNSKNLDKLMEHCCETYRIWNTRIGTSALNRWLDEALMQHTPPMVKGRRFKVRYATQAKIRPPSIVLFANRHDKAIESYLRYLTNHLRDTFKLPGVPLRLIIRTGSNPYVKED